MKRIFWGLFLFISTLAVAAAIMFYTLYDDRVPADKLVQAYLGNAKIQYELSDLYSDLGDIENYTLWMRRSAERGYSPALHYYTGEMGDREQAWKMLKGAAHNGDHFAQIKMANTAKSTDEARRWAVKAASSGEYSKQLQAADIFARTSPPDYVEAYYWRSIGTVSYAAMGGDSNDDATRDRYKAHLTPEQIKNVEERVKLYQPNVCRTTEGHAYTCFKCEDGNEEPFC